MQVFEARADETTLVTITNSGFTGSDDEKVAKALERQNLRSELFVHRFVMHTSPPSSICENRMRGEVVKALYPLRTTE